MISQAPLVASDLWGVYVAAEFLSGENTLQGQEARDLADGFLKITGEEPERLESFGDDRKGA